MSYNYSTVRRYLAELRLIFGVHKTREIMTKLEVCDHGSSVKVRLSPRGREVLLLYMDGFSYKQIGESLGMSLSGVRRHREKMLWQNDCESMMELIARYHRQGS